MILDTYSNWNIFINCKSERIKKPFWNYLFRLEFESNLNENEGFHIGLINDEDKDKTNFNHLSW